MPVNVRQQVRAASSSSTGPRATVQSQKSYSDTRGMGKVWDGPPHFQRSTTSTDEVHSQNRGSAKGTGGRLLSEEEMGEEEEGNGRGKDWERRRKGQGG